MVAMGIDLRESWFIDARRGADAARARADGRRQRAGISAPGTPLRRGPRLLGDGLAAPASSIATRRRSAISASPPTSTRSRSRSSAQPRHDGRGRAHGRGRRRRPRRHQLRLPRAEGDEDRRRRDAARRPGARVPHRLGGRGRRRRARLGEDAPRPARWLPRPASTVGPQLVAAGAVGAHPAPPLGAADVHRHGRSQPHRRARLARRRARHRLGRRHLPRQGAGRPRDDGRRGGDGRTRRSGQPLGPARDRRRRRRGADPRGGRRGARALHPRDGPRARRAARLGLPEEVLRLVPRPRPVPEAVQAGARRARLDRGGRAAPDRGRTRRAAADRAARGRAAVGRRGHARPPRSPSTAAASRRGPEPDSRTCGKGYCRSPDRGISVTEWCTFHEWT